MSSHKTNLNRSVMALAVLTALTALSALADDDEAAALKKPENTIELGVLGVSQSSAKFGEYSGLNKGGAYGIGNLDVRGGSAYDENETGGTQRWSIRGSNLGLSSRDAQATISDQGSWNLGLQYDELRHSLTDSYQTPYSGAMGGNAFTLPGFGLVTNANNPTLTGGISAAQLAAFRTMDIGTTRKNTTLSGGVVIDSHLNYTFDYNHLDQSGAKLMGFGIAGVNGATGEAVSILPMPTNYRTDNYNVAMNWRQDDAYATMSIVGSVFRDGFDSVQFQSWTGASGMQLMPTAPNNAFNQVNLSGGYKLAPQTKLAANFSYGGGSQNVPFVSTNGLLLNNNIPSSLNGSIINTHADAKLTHQASRELLMSVAYKYDQRNNQTTSNLYNFTAISNSASHAVNYPNTPLSTRKEQLEVAGDYRLAQDQYLRMSVSHENYERWCNSYASGGGTAYTATTNCVVAKSSADDKLDATYRIKTNEDTHVRVGMGYSDRKTISDPYALQDFLGQNGAVPGPVPATGNTTPKGQNAGDYYGFYPVFSASRQQQYVKASVNWQANELLELSVSGRYSDDKYPDSTYGVQNGKSWSLNLDATYNYADNGSLNAFVTQQSRQRDMTNLQRYTTTASAASATALNVPAVATWTNKLTDEDLTLGLGFKQGGLMAGKFELAGDMSYSLGNAGYNTQLNYAGATLGVPTGSNILTCSSAQILSCGQLPDIRSTTTRFKLTGTYQVDKSSKVVLMYLQQRLTSSDYFYNGYQGPANATSAGYNPNTLLPTYQTSGSYSVNAFGASFIHSF